MSDVKRYSDIPTCHQDRISFYRRCYILAIAVVLSIILVHVASRNTQTKNGISPSSAEFFSEIIAKYGSERVIDRVEMEDGSTMIVEDRYVEENGSWSAVRVVTPKPKHGHTFMYLEIPSELSKANMDSRRWNLLQGKLKTNSPHLALAETVFKSDFVDLSRDTNASVLLIGLAGGSVSSFLYTHFPEMIITGVELSGQMVNIARRWFGLPTDERYKVVITDGIKFMEEEVEKGAKYDAILIDTCALDPDMTKTFICPVHTFMETNAIDNMAELTRYRGIVALDVVTAKLGLNETLAKLYPKFSKFFNYCNIRSNHKHNQIFYCMHVQPVEEKQINLLEFTSDTHDESLKQRIRDVRENI